MCVCVRVCACTYLYMNILVKLYICTCMYIPTQRESERGREGGVFNQRRTASRPHLLWIAGTCFHNNSQCSNNEAANAAWGFDSRLLPKIRTFMLSVP